MGELVFTWFLSRSDFLPNSNILSEMSAVITPETTSEMKGGDHAPSPSLCLSSPLCPHVPAVPLLVKISLHPADAFLISASFGAFCMCDLGYHAVNGVLLLVTPSARNYGKQ